MLVTDSLEPLSNELPELFKILGLYLGESGEHEGELAFGESTKPPVWGLGFKLASLATAGVCANCNGLGVCMREIGRRLTFTVEVVEFWIWTLSLALLWRSDMTLPWVPTLKHVLDLGKIIQSFYPPK